MYIFSHEHLVVDEILLGYRGKCPFKVYIPSKRHKYGLKLYLLVDPVNMYLVGSKVHVTKKKSKKSKKSNVILEDPDLSDKNFSEQVKKI